MVAIGCYMLSDRWHPRFRNLNSTVPVDVVKVKSYVKSLFNPMRVPVRVSVNKLHFVTEGIMHGLIGVFRNSLSIRRFWGKMGKMEAKKGESSSSPSPLPRPPSKISSPLAP